MFFLLLFAICMIGFIWKLFVFGVRASWGIMKLLCTVVLFPVILIGMVVGGLLFLQKKTASSGKLLAGKIMIFQGIA